MVVNETREDKVEVEREGVDEANNKRVERVADTYEAIPVDFKEEELLDEEEAESTINKDGTL